MLLSCLWWTIPNEKKITADQAHFQISLKQKLYLFQMFLSANLLFKKQWMPYKYLTNWKMKILKGSFFMSEKG